MKRKITARRNYTVYNFPTPETVPEGHYWTRIDNISDSITTTSKTAIDVDYTFQDENGNLYQVRQRYADGSYAQDSFFDAMVDAGVPDGADVMKAVGVTEEIDFGYVGDFGTIKSRCPYVEE